ncbi:hypothetical protein GCM10023261_01790 [Bartonella jaculi]|uniref:Uncharacterized protein n=2 Tax=Bartonella jaculi TaxID=686226 RepID=A0ABP9N1R9_9HYPH
MITGISSLFLKNGEKASIAERKSLAFILFAHNIGEADDIKALSHLYVR